MMKHRSSRPALVALCLGAFSTAAFAQPAPTTFFFHDGDRAMITGDSITEQRQYSTLVESYVLSRFPKWNITFRNTGWSGDTMGLRTRGGLDVGFTRDLAPWNPTAVTIDMGMNDARSGDGGYDDYLKNARTMADKFKALGTRVAFVTSSPEERYDADQPAGSAYNVMLRKYSTGLQSVATEKGDLFVDQLNPMIKTIEDGRVANALSPHEGGPRLIPDGVHGNWGGHTVMAADILKGLGAPSLVSSVELDAKTGRSVSGNARVSDVKAGPTLTFTRLDAALPWPIMPSSDVTAALQIPSFTPMDDLSRYMLKVTSLDAASYDVAIDGTKVGTFTKEQLAAGVNLSQTAGPISDQGQNLLRKIIDKNNLFFQQWRGVQLATFPAWVPAAGLEEARAGEVRRIGDQITAAEAEINTLRQPTPHVWTLTPVAPAPPATPAA